MSIYKQILIPTDGSEYTKAAALHGLTLAKLTGAEVTALFVIDVSTISSFPLGPAIPDLTPVLEGEGKKAVEFVRVEGEKMGVKVTAKIELGSPASTIIKDSAKFDLVVMGTLGRSGVSKLLLGSVAEKVIRFAECPVLVVRNS
jgi:nucleotide-binding universal stress UspA family protein